MYYSCYSYLPFRNTINQPLDHSQILPFLKLKKGIDWTNYYYLCVHEFRKIHTANQRFSIDQCLIVPDVSTKSAGTGLPSSYRHVRHVLHQQG